MAIIVKKPTILTFEELCRANTAPVLRADSNWVKEDGPLKANGNVLKSLAHSGAPFGSFADRADTDANGNILKVTTTGTFYGKFGILTLKANGTYTYKLYSQAQKPAAFATVQGLSDGETLTESFKYKATDGFVTKGSVLKVTIFGTDDQVTITDLTPALLGGDTVVDEDGLPVRVLDAGRPGETDANESATNTGTFKISAPDGIDDLIVGGTVVISNGVFAAPVTITTPLGNEITITAFDPATGVVSYSYKLIAPETHPGAGEDSIFDSIPVKLTDTDGSSATASLDVRIVDDQPTIAVCRHHYGDEQVAHLSIVNMCVPPTSLIVDETDLATDATSNFSGAFIPNFGSDGPGTIAYTLGTSGAPSGLVDTLTGETVLVAKEGNDIVGRAGSGGPVVFTISIDPVTGVVTLDQSRAVVHDPNSGPNDFEGLPLDLVSVTATITDADGDQATATLDAGSFFGFYDDAPTATDEPAQNVPEGGVVTGQLDFAPGNDGATVTAINGTVLIFGADGYSQVIDLGLGTIKVKADGAYEFNADNPTNSPVPPITGEFTVTDGDGDADVGTFEFLIEDANTPTGGVAGAAVDDDGLLDGNLISTSGDLDANAGDDPADTSEATFTGTLGGSVGGDVPGTFSFAALNGTTGPVGLETVTYSWAGTILTATGPRGPLFQVEVTDPATGAYKVTLLDNVLHAGGPNDEEVNAVVILGYVITDSDGSTAPGTLTIVFDDDAPTVSLDQSSYGDTVLDETSPGSLVPSIGLGGFAAGDDPDVGGAGAIATATSVGPIVSPTIAFGADGPAPSGSIDYTLSVGALSPGVAVTDGSPITLVSVSPTVVVGVVSGGAFNGLAAFAIEIDPVLGTIKVEQYLSLDHPLNPDPNDVLDIASGALLAQIRVTDADNDQAVAGYSIGDKIRFFDDGPTVPLSLGTGAALTIDETDGVTANAGEIDPIGGDLGTATLSASSYLIGATNFGADGPGTVAFSISVNAATPASLFDTATGLQVVLVSQSATAINGTAGPGGPVVFTISINPTSGDLTVKQLRAIVHDDPADPDEAASPAILAHGSLNITKVVTDGDGDQAANSISIGSVIRFEDDGPVAGAIAKTINESAAVDSNVMLVLDVSGSMNDPSGLTGLSRLDVLKASVAALLEQYDAIGNVAVRIVTFSSNAAPIGGVWMTVDAAKAAVLALTAGGSTNYDEALTDAASAFASAGKISGAQNVSYFISDGQPTAPSGDIGIDAGEQATWENFLDANDVVSFALGAGSGVSVPDLQPVAYNGANGTQIAPIVVTDLSQLTATLVGTVAGATTSGNLLTDGPGSFGADGGFISSVAIGGKTFSYDPVTDAISVSGAGAATHSFNAATNVITISTAIGGQLTLDLDNGAYSYTGPASVASNQSDVFSYALKDGDGDVASSTLTINILNADRPPLVRDDAIITNIGGSGAAIVIPQFALTYNDSDPDGQVIALTAAGAPQSDLTSVAVGAGIVTATDNDSDGGTFTYTGSTTAPAGSDTATVTVTRVSSGADPLDGNGLANILINNDNSDTIRGFEGDDVLIGNGGNDSLLGGLGSDLMQGGAGNDTFVFSNANESPGLAGADTILDFDVASASERIDLSAIFGGALGFNIAQTGATIANTVTWQQDAGTNTTIVRADVNGNATADFVLKLSGLHILTASEFVL